MDALKRIRQRLRDDPANLELANVYWAALAGQGGEADLRCGRDVIDAYREATQVARGGGCIRNRVSRTVSGKRRRPPYHVLR